MVTVPFYVSYCLSSVDILFSSSKHLFLSNSLFTAYTNLEQSGPYLLFRENLGYFEVY